MHGTDRIVPSSASSDGHKTTVFLALIGTPGYGARDGSFRDRPTSRPLLSLDASHDGFGACPLPYASYDPSAARSDGTGTRCRDHGRSAVRIPHTDGLRTTEP
jgi:hypothetical protein